jgi:hypothetical protein
MKNQQGIRAVLKKTIAHQRFEGKVCHNTAVGIKRKKAGTPFCGV